MKTLTKKRPKGLKRSADLSRHFSIDEHNDLYTYLRDLGFTSGSGQWTWQRGEDRAYIVNPEMGLLFVDVFVEAA
jgi:hypothetical protein